MSEMAMECTETLYSQYDMTWHGFHEDEPTLNIITDWEQKPWLHWKSFFNR
jgi:hypothetical protein